MADTTKLAEELEQDMRRGVGFDGERTVIVDKRIALRVLAALRAPAAEPVAWMHTQGNYTEASDRPLDADEVSRGWTQVPLYAAINGPAACSAELSVAPSQEGVGSAGSGATMYTPGAWHIGGTFLPDTPDAHCSIWGKAPPGCQSGNQVAQYVHPMDAAFIVAAQEMADELARVRGALERSRGCIQGLLARTPVRDADETLAEIDAALAASAKGEG